jgi:hypothetical protein
VGTWILEDRDTIDYHNIEGSTPSGGIPMQIFVETDG